MGAVYYTVTAVILYFLADWILNSIELRRGERFEQRSLVFFAIISILALSSFAVIRNFTSF